MPAAGCRRHMSTLRLLRPQQKRTFLALSLALPGKTCPFSTSAGCSLWRTDVLAMTKDSTSDSSAGAAGSTASKGGDPPSRSGPASGSGQAADSAAVSSSAGEDGGKGEKGDGKAKKILKGEGSPLSPSMSLCLCLSVLLSLSLLLTLFFCLSLSLSLSGGDHASDMMLKSCY